MIAKLKLVGDGTEEHPYRVNLPTYQTLFYNVEEGYALVVIPDDIHGLTDDDLKASGGKQTSRGHYVEALSPKALEKMHAHFDKHYVEHKGKFRVENV